MSLEGKIILITRPQGQSQEIQCLLENKGGKVVFQPVIEILPVEDDTIIRQYISGMEPYGLPRADQTGRLIQNRAGNRGFDWLLFSSANGVGYFMQYFDRKEPVCVPEKRVRLAAVGPGTAAALLRFGFQADVIPERHQAEGMVEALKDEAVQGKRFLSIRGNR
ncbi:MAG: uroporphyrinogen-III synthase, partial [Thermoguttaceae bacterium]|nr:uroporphyrinogen-III synthase [Thermoguttaceae bacterium]